MAHLKLPLLLIVLLQVSGCVVSPRIELSESIDFDYVVPNQQFMDYGDPMCSV